MINTETIKGSVRIHGVKSLTAEAGPEDSKMQDQVAWLDITTSAGDKVSIFMPYPNALAYASAINTVNDRDAVEKSELEPLHEEQSMLGREDANAAKF